MRWEQGRADIDALLAAGELERVAASREHADRLLAQAKAHSGAVAVIATVDPVGAYQLLYDAARKALCAVLENQGLRATSRGGHLVIYRAITAQLQPPTGQVLRPFDRMRRRRNEAEYPTVDSPVLVAGDVVRDLPKVEQLIELSGRVLDEMGPY